MTDSEKKQAQRPTLPELTIKERFVGLYQRIALAEMSADSMGKDDLEAIGWDIEGLEKALKSSSTALETLEALKGLEAVEYSRLESDEAKEGLWLPSPIHQGKFIEYTEFSQTFRALIDSLRKEAET